MRGALVGEPPSRPQLDRRSRRYVLLVPPGDIELRATLKGHLETVSRVRAGGRAPIDVDLFLYKAASVTVRLRSRGAVVPVSVKSASLTKAGDGERPRRFWARFSKGIATFDHLEAGVWRLVVEPIPGFTGVLESDVALADGESADVNIELSGLGGGD